MKKIKLLLLGFLLCLSSPLFAADELPDDGYDYMAALAQFKADTSAEVNKTVEDWDGTRTMTLVYKMEPTIKDGNVVGAQVTMQRKVMNENSGSKGRVIEQDVSTWFSEANPGTYMSIGQLRAKYPQFEGKRTANKPDSNDLAMQLTLKMLEIKKDVLDRRIKLIQDGKRFWESSNNMTEVYEKEKQRLGEKYAELKVPGSTGGKLIYDAHSGEFTSDKIKNDSIEGVMVSQEELLVWEMSGADRSESDWKAERQRFIDQTATEEKNIEKLVADYIILKKATAAVERARESKQMNGDDELVRNGMQALDNYRK
jgi:hypothetical protein